MSAFLEQIKLWLANPMVQAALLGAFIILLIWLIVSLLRKVFRPRPSSDTREALLRLDDSQRALTGRLQQVAEGQMQSHRQLVDYVEKRFNFAQKQMDESLGKSVANTSQSLGALMQRLEAIDKAQTKIEKLSGDVLGLQDILSNKQTRGNFGEIQLYDLVASALPKDSYKTQATLSNGSRVDCLIMLPHPPGPIAIDSKFPLEAYEALRNATTPQEQKAATTFFKTTIRKHIRDIAEKYIIEGETADGAIMFLPSEAVYAELHANFPELVREGFAERIWIVSPTTCMATLTTMRAIMKDTRMRKEAGAIRHELAVLVKDITRLNDRVLNLDRHFNQATQDIEAIKISTQKVASRSTKLENLDFESDKSQEILPRPKR